MLMKISVAMATYNGADYIIEQLDSIRNQTKIVDEVIISDDHSPDGTYSIVKEYIKRYGLNTWKVVYDSVGKGLIDNFYNALRETTGDIIFLSDQDNIWHPEKVKTLESFYIENPDIMCINNSFRYIDKNGKIIEFVPPKGTSNNGLILKEIKKNKKELIPLSLVINKNIGPGLSMSVRRQIIEKYLSGSRKVELHDFEINCISALNNGLYFYNRILDEYRIFEGQAVSVGIVKYRKKLDILKAKVELAKKHLEHRIVFIEELIGLCSDKENEKYLNELLKLYKLKGEVVLNRKLLKWLKEKRKYKEIAKTYGNIDMRYCYIDLIAGILK